VVVYSTSRLSRELFHALAFERELARAGVEIFYTLTAGDQTSPEGRLIRHMFQALDQFEVEKLGREVRRGQTENTKQGYRNGGRAPYGYRLRHEPHPDPARARAGDKKSRLVADPEQAPVIAEMFALFLAGSGYAEIADHLNRPGGPPPRATSTPATTPRAGGRRRRSARCWRTPSTPGGSTGTGSTSAPPNRARDRWSAAPLRNGSRPSAATRR
jgi:DNA invertase Pin-like site-specific DNA recombinase